jgi:hypothetical protein
MSAVVWIDAWPRSFSLHRLRQCSGMTPEVVWLDLARADEFSVAWQSLPRTDPQTA